MIERWYTEWRAGLSGRAAALREADLTTLSDEQLGQHLDATIALADDGGQIHFRLHAALTVTLGELADTCRELLGWGDDQIFDLLSGTSTASTEPAVALTALVALVQRSPAFESGPARPRTWRRCWRTIPTSPRPLPTTCRATVTDA